MAYENRDAAQSTSGGPLAMDLARYRIHDKLQWLEPSLWVVVVYRWGQWIERRRFPAARVVFRLLYFPIFAFVTIATGIQLPRHARIQGGLRIWHFGCIILNPSTIIGKGCTLRHGVTIGNRRSENDVPILGNDVDVGAGAKLLGAIRIGNNVSIGANAVVLSDVPDDHIAVGVPARILPRRAHSQ